MSYKPTKAKDIFALKINLLNMLEKLMLTEYALQLDLNRAQIKLLAFRSIKKLLSEIDFSAEEIPDDSERFVRLLVLLKGEPLTNLEMEIIEELADANTMAMSALKHMS